MTEYILLDHPSDVLKSFNLEPKDKDWLMILNLGWFHRGRSNIYALLLLSQASSLSEQSWKLVERQLQQQIGQQIWLKKFSPLKLKINKSQENDKTKMLVGACSPSKQHTTIATWEQISYLQGNMFEGVFRACISGEEVTFKNTLFCLSLRNIRTVYLSYFSAIFVHEVLQTKVLFVNCTTLTPVSNYSRD